MSPSLPIHFYTIVLNGEPFIRHHIEVFRRLKVPWTWHVVEGLAAHQHDTAWGARRGGRLPAEFLATGRSIDGTTEYLDLTARQHPAQVRLYRKPLGACWDGKIEMVRAPLADLNEEALLWQVDADELWTTDQIERVHALFERDRTKTAAWFYCHFFVGPEICSSEPGVFGNLSHMEWLRVWRFRPGDSWQTHEPPALVRPAAGGVAADLGRLNPFGHRETDALGLRFQHFAYATEAQLRFKEDYYGYREALSGWNRLQAATSRAPRLRRHLRWVWESEIGKARTLRTLGRRLLEPWIPAARAEPARRRGIVPLAQLDAQGGWHFHCCESPSSPAPHIVLVRTDRIGDHLLSFGLIAALRAGFPAARLTLACPEDVAELIPDRSQVNEVVLFNRERGHADKAYRRDIAQRLQRVPVDWLLCPQFNRDNLANKLSALIQAPRRVGFASEPILLKPVDRRKYRRYARYFHDQIPVQDREQPELTKYDCFLKGLGVAEPLGLPSFQPPGEAEAAADALLEKAGATGRSLIAVFPGAANPVRNVPQLGKALATVPELREMMVLGLGDVSHRPLLEQVLKESGMTGVNLAGQTTLPVAAAILRRCRLGAGAETGLGHLACAVGCPNVIVLGGGDFGRFYPYSPLTTAAALPLSCYQCHYSCRHATVYCVAAVPVSTIGSAILHALTQRNSKPLVCVPRSCSEPTALKAWLTTARELAEHPHGEHWSIREV